MWLSVLSAHLPLQLFNSTLAFSSTLLITSKLSQAMLYKEKKVIRAPQPTLEHPFRLDARAMPINITLKCMRICRDARREGGSPRKMIMQ